MASTKKKGTASTPSRPKPNVFVYVGPSLRGIITNGSIYFGTIQEVKDCLRLVIERFPDVERLLVPDTEVAEARAKIENGKGLISRAYMNLSQNK